MALQSYLLVMFGTWLTANGIVSIVFYYGKENETWIKNHSIRLIRIAIGIVLIIIGAQFLGII